MTENSIFLIIGNTLIYWYGLVVCLGLLGGAALTCWLRHKQGHRDLSDMLIALLASLACAFIFARIFFCWHGNSMFNDSAQYFNLGNGGYSIYGALFGMPIGLAAAAMIQHRDVGEMLDISVPGAALAIAVGRMGAAFSGENLGLEVSTGLFQRFPFAMYSENEGIWRSALFTYQSLFSLLLCAGAMYLLHRKYGEKTLNCKNGDIYLLFVVFFFVLQGVFESYRVDALLFNSKFITKLQTVPAGMPLGAIFSAAALSVFILRLMWRKKFALSTLVYPLICAVSYFCYFNIVLRLEIPDALAIILFALGCLGLLAVGVHLFLSLAGVQLSALQGPREPSRPAAAPKKQPTGRPAQPSGRQPRPSGGTQRPSAGRPAERPAAAPRRKAPSQKPRDIDYWS